MPLIDPITMSSIDTSSQSQVSKPSLPVEPLTNDFTVIANAAHHVLLLSTYYLRFSTLVANPVSVLLIGLVDLAVTQGFYCIFCLPLAGSTGKQVKKGLPKNKAAAAKRAGDGVTLTQISAVVISLLLSTLSIPILTVLQILLGAPLTTHLPHTILASTHLALLAVFPLVYVHGADSSKWLEVVSAQSPVDEVFGGAVGAFVGAWLGAVPIPLDWDREWQRWPVTVVTGCYLGYVIGKLVGKSFKGQKIAFD